MREIKFRCWDKDRNKMVQPAWELDKYGNKISYELEVVNSIPMQFTGLHDKNGKEIYEFDYLERPEVNDNSKSWCVFWGSGKYILQNISTGDILDCNEENTQDKEVVGNRYETPREHEAMASDL